MTIPETEISYLISAESRLSDIRALMDSYAVEAWSEGVLYRRQPLHMFAYRGTTRIAEKYALPEIDHNVDIRLCKYEPPPKNDRKYTRWPFYVDQPLAIMLRWDQQWWIYKFMPGKTYEERQIEEIL